MELFKLFGTIAIEVQDAIDAIDETTAHAKESESKLSKVERAVTTVGDTMQGMGRKLMPATLAIGGLAATSVKTAADFESSMSQVAATMGMTSEEINNGSEDFERLSNAARDMGKKTKFSASEAAQALNYLALAGYDVDKSINTLPVVLNLAAAGDMALASASDMVTDAMSALGDTAGTTENFVDKMAKASQKSNTSVSQLGEAILTVGGTAKNLKNGTTELNAALGILADNGVKGAEGGTALRNIILSLTSPTEDATEVMEELGVAVFDNQGNMRALNDIFNDLNSGMANLSTEEKMNVLNNIFNKVDLKSANALLANSGERFDELSGYLNDCDGAAQDMADTMQNNLNGQLTTLKSALSEAAISIGTQLVPIIKDATSVVQDWTDKFNSLDESQQQMIIKIALAIAAIAPMLLMFGKMTSSIGSAISMFSNLSSVLGSGTVSFEGITTALGGITASGVAVVGVILALIAVFATLWATNKEFKENILSIWDEIKTTFTDLTSGIVEEINSLGFDFKSFGEMVKAIWMGLCNFLAPAIKVVFQNISNIFKAWSTLVLGLVKVFVGIFTGDFSKMGEGVKTIISAFTNFIKNTFTNIFNGINEMTGGKLGEIATKFKDKFTTIKETVRNAINAVKGFFDNLKLKLPDIKLPHFKLEGKFDLSKMEVPKLGVDWYAEGGIMTRPTAFGINGNDIMVGGEAGAEAILPIDKLQGYVTESVASQNKEIVGVLMDILNAIISMDDGMGENLKNALDGTSIKFNNREFSRLVRAVN